MTELGQCPFCRTVLFYEKGDVEMQCDLCDRIVKIPMILDPEETERRK